MFDLKSTVELYFMSLKSDEKFEEKLTGGFEKEFGKASPEHTKFSKLVLSLDLFIKSRKCMSLKNKGYFCVMAIKNDAKIEEEFTCQAKKDIMNLTKLHQSTQNSQNWDFHWNLL